MITSKDARKGNVLKYKGGWWVVHGTVHITPGNWRGFVNIKMKNLDTGAMVEERFSSDERFEVANMEQKDMEYLYDEGAQMIFMEQETYEQVPIDRDIIGDDRKWMKSNMPCKVNYCDGRIIGVELPHVVELKVVDTEPGLKSATVTNVYKPAKLETGAEVTVPPFIEKGEIIRIDTRDGQYMERASK